MEQTQDSGICKKKLWHVLCISVISDSSFNARRKFCVVDESSFDAASAFFWFSLPKQRVRVTVTFGWAFCPLSIATSVPQLSAPVSATLARWRVWGRWVADLARGIQLVLCMSSPQCGELIEPIGSHKRCPQPFDPQVASSPSLRGRLCREQRETRARNPINTRSLWVKDGRLVVVPPLFHAPRIENPDPSSHLRVSLRH